MTADMLPIPHDGADDEVRPFPVPSLLRDVQRACDAIPAGRTVAVIAWADQDQAGMAAMARLKGGWSFMAEIGKPWGGKLEARAAAVWTR